MTELYLKIAFFLFEKWLSRQKNAAEMTKLYNNFLKQIGVQSEAANKRSIALEDKLKLKQEELRKKNEAENVH